MRGPLTRNVDYRNRRRNSHEPEKLIALDQGDRTGTDKLMADTLHVYDVYTHTVTVGAELEFWLYTALGVFACYLFIRAFELFTRKGESE